MAAATDVVDDAPHRRGVTIRISGLTIVVFGLLWLLGDSHLHLSADTMLSILLMGIGAWLLLTRRSGHRALPIILGGVLVFVLMNGSGTYHWNFGHAVGNRIYVVGPGQRPARSYQVAAGDLGLDLGAADFPSGTTTVDAKDAAGDLNVTVPADVGVEVHVAVAVGSYSGPGGVSEGGVGVNRTLTFAGFSSARRRLVLNLSVAAGDVNVMQVKSAASTNGVASSSTVTTVQIPAAPSTTIGQPAGQK